VAILEPEEIVELEVWRGSAGLPRWAWWAAGIAAGLAFVGGIALVMFIWWR
jgi:hypothetical protein